MIPFLGKAVSPLILQLEPIIAKHCSLISDEHAYTYVPKYPLSRALALQTTQQCFFLPVASLPLVAYEGDKSSERSSNRALVQ
jgi:hypothetical protein